MTDEKKQSTNNYIYVALAVIVLIAMLAWAYLSGRNDGAQHKTNQPNANRTQ